MHRNVSRHGKSKGRLSDGRTRPNYNEFGILKPAKHVVEIIEARRHTGVALLVSVEPFNCLDGFFDDLTSLPKTRGVLLAGDLENPLFRLLEDLSTRVTVVVSGRDHPV